MTLKRLLTAAFTLLLTLVFNLSSYAQDKTVTGKVTDSKDGSPVAGATVQAKGSSRGTSTKADGSFSISVGSNVSSLVISSVGFESQEVKISGGAVSVSLVSTSSSLNDVVVIGYGTSKKSDLTGSVGSVKAKDFNKGIVTSPDQLIQGKVAGVQILANSGQPGGAATIKIRGTSSVRAGTQPLVVVDGVPLTGGSGRPGLGAPGLGGTPGSNPLNFINPADIASMDVLKDASATAIYGSRGSNGVIIITTKRGTTGAPTVDFGYSIGTSQLAKKLDVLTASEYKSALTKYGLTSGDYGSSVDAMDAITRTGTTQNINIAVSGGSDAARYRFSASALDEKGIIKESGLKKYTVGFNGGYKFLESKNLGVDVNFNYTNTKEDIVPITNNAGFQGSLIGMALMWNPTHPFKKVDGSYWVEPQFGASSINPLFMLEMYDDVANVNTILASISPYYKISKSLEYRMLYSLNSSVGTRKAMIGRELLNLNDVKNRGWASISNQADAVQQFTHTLNYNKNLTSDLNLNGVAGYEYTKFDFSNNGLTAQDFSDVGIKYYNMMGYASQSSRNLWGYQAPTNELQSYFVRAAVNYQGKYLLTGTFRADGSTKFGSNNKYGYFPSFAAAWNISKENFMSNVSAVSNVKLRLGWGKTGNQEFPAGASLYRQAVTGIGSISPVNVGNPDLKWESTTTANAGLEFNVLNDRIGVTVDYFHKDTKDVLFELNFPVPGGSGSVWKNLDGIIENEGVELAVNAAVVKQSDLQWNVGVNATLQKNMYTKQQGVFNTGELSGQGMTGAYAQRIVAGYPLNVYYLRDFQGIDANGQSKYKEDGYTLFYGESPNPSTLLGINTDLTYKKWTASANLNGAFGHYLYNNTANSVVPITNLGTRNVAKSFVNASVKEDLSNPIAPSTRFIEKGDYLKLSNLSISYNLGTIAKVIKNARVSLNGQNLLVITKYTGFDPEVNTDKAIGGIPSQGIEYMPYPSSRRFQVAFNFSL